MKCERCASVGTNSKGPPKHAPSCPAAEPLTPIDRITACRRIVKNHQWEFLEDVVIDAQTANAIVVVYDALNEENKAKFTSIPLERMGITAWKILSRPKLTR